MKTLLVFLIASGLLTASEFGTQGNCQIIYDVTPGDTGTIALTSCVIPANATIYRFASNFRAVSSDGAQMAATIPATVPAPPAQYTGNKAAAAAAAAAANLVAKSAELAATPTVPAKLQIDAVIIPVKLPTTVDASDPLTWLFAAAPTSPAIQITGGTLDQGRIIVNVFWVVNLCRKDVCP